LALPARPPFTSLSLLTLDSVSPVLPLAGPAAMPPEAELPAFCVATAGEPVPLPDVLLLPLLPVVPLADGLPVAAPLLPPVVAPLVAEAVPPAPPVVVPPSPAFALVVGLPLVADWVLLPPLALAPESAEPLPSPPTERASTSESPPRVAAVPPADALEVPVVVVALWVPLALAFADWVSVSVALEVEPVALTSPLFALVLAFVVLPVTAFVLVEAWFAVAVFDSGDDWVMAPDVAVPVCPWVFTMLKGPVSARTAGTNSPKTSSNPAMPAPMRILLSMIEDPS
jgi:hypothetical protein